MSIFEIINDLQKQELPKNPYPLYYYLLQNPDELIKTNKKGFNLLTLTLSSYSKNVVEILLDIISILILSNKIDKTIFQTLDKNGNNIFSTVLRIKSDKQRHDRLETLLKLNIEDYNLIRDKNNDTPLHIACRYSDYYSVYLLTNRKFTRKVNTLGKNKVTPVYYAIINKNIGMFEYLLDIGAILKGIIEEKEFDYIPLIYEQNDKRLEKTYEKFLKKQNKRKKQKLIRELKKKDVREKYKQLCQDLQKTNLNDLVKYARSINIKIYDDKTQQIKPKQELCQSISQRVLIKEYFPNFSFSESYT
jgi:ankyrin repeat protein